MPKVSVDSGNFTMQLQQFGTLFDANMAQFASRFCQALSNEIVRNTPVDTGYLRASWSPNIDASSVTIGDVFEFSNHAVYARRLEFGFIGTDKLGRIYNQAGRGFVRAVINRADQIADEILVGM